MHPMQFKYPRFKYPPASPMHEMKSFSLFRASVLPVVALATILLLALAGVARANADAAASASDEVAVFEIRAGKKAPVQRVTIELYADAAPNTVANFKKLVRAKFYNGLSFHRVFPHRMMQTGDPLSAKNDRARVGTGGPGYTIPAEINRHKHEPGAVAMARLPDKINPARVSNGSQFYIALEPMPRLDGQYTVFGKVAEGLDLLDALSAKATDTNDNPVERIVIVRARILPHEKAVALGTKAKEPRGIGKFFRFGGS